MPPDPLSTHIPYTLILHIEHNKSSSVREREKMYLSRYDVRRVPPSDVDQEPLSS